jgi:hypothetical protein
MHHFGTGSALRQEETGTRSSRGLLGTEPECTVKRAASGRYDLKMSGKMPHGWVVNLTSGIAAAGISIEKGAAKKISPSVWEASFELRPVSFGVNPGALDYLQLCSRGMKRGSAIVPTLDRFTLLEPDASRSALCVEITAVDQTGFLAGILDRFSFFSLFPEEMIIETSGGKIFDRFHLSAPGGMAPSAEVAAVLKRNLEGILSKS